MHLLLLGCYVASSFACAVVAGAIDRQVAAPTQRTQNVRSANLSLPASPYGLIYAREDVAFAAIGAGKILVLNTSVFVSTIISEKSVPAPLWQEDWDPLGLAITSDKHTLLVPVGLGAVAIDVQKAIVGEPEPIVGLLSGTSALNQSRQITLSADEQYLFVTQEAPTAYDYYGGIQSFHVERARNGSVMSTYLGYIQLGIAVVGSALSRDGSKLYVTSELEVLNKTQGTLSILDVETLKSEPSEALLRSVDAGCQPVRVAVSPNNKYVWVTARASNKLLAFDAEKLESNITSATMVAEVQVGTSPVGLTFVHGGQYLVTADSNRNNYTYATSGLILVDVDAALEGTQIFPRMSTGLFPREFVASPDGKTLLVSTFDSHAIQALDVTDLDCY